MTNELRKGKILNTLISIRQRIDNDNTSPELKKHLEAKIDGLEEELEAIYEQEMKKNGT